MEIDTGSARRVAVLAGLASFAVFVAAMMGTPSSPIADEPIGEIARQAVERRDGYLWGAYLFSLQTTAFLVFAAALVALLQRRQGSGGWWLVAAVGAGGSAVDLIGQSMLAAWVYAAGHGATGDALRAVYSAHTPIVYLGFLPVAVFLLGIGCGARSTQLLPRWLAWAAIALGALLVVGAGSITGNETEEGVFGVAFVLGWLGINVWTIACTVAVWRGERRAGVAPVAA